MHRLLPLRLLFLLVLAAGCRSAPTLPPAQEAALYLPDRDLGALFHDVQMARLFDDSKTFADAEPLAPPAEIRRRYAHEKEQPGFALQAFVDRHFALPHSVTPAAPPAGAAPVPMATHLRSLWPTLTREADSTARLSTLLPLPNPYVVPGGRFREGYYWDSYFTLLGLVESGRLDLARDMLGNFAYLARTWGHIPNGNRTYYLSRSQPPFFSAMVMLYAAATDTSEALRYTDALRAEHDFWMDGEAYLKGDGDAYRRVVQVGGATLNRYWDDRPVPRPESYREDYTLAQSLPEGQRQDLYRNLRAAAESGWDFSSRWMTNPEDLRTLETTQIAPVCLNSLLYHLETTLALLYQRLDRPAEAGLFAARADARRTALLRLMWHEGDGFFYDVYLDGTPTRRLTMATAYPLYFGLATKAQAERVAEALRRDLLAPGGFITTQVQSGQQWDAPNGWPPLQWLGIEGLRRYGQNALADTVSARWLALNRRVYRSTGRMMEKYDVLDLDREAGGGEYPTQDGFGWTNGVALALMAAQQ